MLITKSNWETFSFEKHHWGFVAYSRLWKMNPVQVIHTCSFCIQSHMLLCFHTFGSYQNKEETEANWDSDKQLGCGCWTVL